jgi:hypothetical protein
MVATDQYEAEVFPEPPLKAFRRQKTIGEYLIRAKVPPSKSRSKRELTGMTKCNNPCQACPGLYNGMERGEKWQFYCKQRYIGEMKRSLAKRLSEHRGYITRMFPTKATGIHFNQRGHSISDVRITIIEKKKATDKSYIK